MSDRRHHWLTRLYPPAWRERYGDELDELLSDRCGWRETVDVVKGAVTERLLHSTGKGGEAMQTYPGNVAMLVRKPSAIAPIIMSVSAFTFNCTYVPNIASLAVPWCIYKKCGTIVVRSNKLKLSPPCTT